MNICRPLLNQKRFQTVKGHFICIKQWFDWNSPTSSLGLFWLFFISLYSKTIRIKGLKCLCQSVRENLQLAILLKGTPGVTGVAFWYSCRAGGLQLYYKEILTKVLSCGYCEIFKNTYFEEHLRTAASVLLIIKLIIINIGHLPTSS